MAGKMPGFFSDLDRTLLYSNKHIQDHHKSTAGHLAVEQYESKPLSFLHLQAWKRLVQSAGTDYMFIPTTTRTLRQYRRIILPDVNVQAAIVLNGAKILIDGIEDYEWSKIVSQQVKSLDLHPVRLFERLRARLTDDEEVHDIRCADDHFVYIIGETRNSPRLDTYTIALAQETGYTRSKQGRKTYLIPPTVSKGVALNRVKEYFDLGETFAAGDSLLDFSMADTADHFLFPTHGEQTPRADLLMHTQSRSIDAGSEILKFVHDSLKLPL